jgi:hypothetical protein
MERELSAQAANLGRPLFVVDSLLWMRDALPPAWRGMRQLFAQNFIGLAECPLVADPRVQVVGPLVQPVREREVSPAAGLLVQLGGCEPAGGNSAGDGYARFVVENLLASVLPEALSHRTTLIAGQECIRKLRRRYRGSCIEFLSLSHAGALVELDRAALVLTAPGLTATLEACQRGVPTCFLPPQNYSQWCILRRLRTAGLAPGALHWEDLPTQQPLADRLGEADRNPLVCSALARHTVDPQAGRELQARLCEMARIDGVQLARRQGAFFASLGPPATAAIADRLAAEWFSRQRGTPAAVPA